MRNKKKVLHKTMSFRYKDKNYIRLSYRFDGKINVISVSTCVITNYPCEHRYTYTIEEAIEKERNIITKCKDKKEVFFENLHLGEKIIIPECK